MGLCNTLTFAFMHHPYLVCILFGMPSLHLFTFLMFFYYFFLIFYLSDIQGRHIAYRSYLFPSKLAAFVLSHLYMASINSNQHKSFTWLYQVSFTLSHSQASPVFRILYWMQTKEQKTGEAWERGQASYLTLYTQLCFFLPQAHIRKGVKLLSVSLSVFLSVLWKNFKSECRQGQRTTTLYGLQVYENLYCLRSIFRDFCGWAV